MDTHKPRHRPQPSQIQSLQLSRGGFNLLQVKENATVIPRVDLHLFGRAVEPMSPDKVEAFDAIMRKALWMLDVFLHDPRLEQRQSFLWLFKTSEYTSAIRWIVMRARDVIASYLVGQIPVHFPNRISFVSGSPKNGLPGVVGEVLLTNTSHPVMILRPQFFIRDRSGRQLTSFHRVRLEPLEVREDVWMIGGVSTLIHELMHLMSIRFNSEFVSMTFGKWGLPQSVTYAGMPNCIALASFIDGAALAICKADTYSTCITMLSYEYLNRVFDQSTPDKSFDAASVELTTLIGKDCVKLRQAFELATFTGSIRRFELGPSMTKIVEQDLSDESKAVFAAKKREVQELIARPPWAGDQVGYGLEERGRELRRGAEIRSILIERLVSMKRRSKSADEFRHRSQSST